jgi:hypothetical protein
MSEVEKPKYLEDMARYNPAYVGMYALNHADEKEQGSFLKGATRTLIDRLYDPKTRDLDILTKAALASEQGMQTMLHEALGQYEKASNQCTFANFYYSNAKAIDSIISKDKQEKFNAIVKKYGAKSIGSIKDSYKDAQLIKEGSDKSFTKEQKEKADKTIEELKSIVAIISQIDRASVEFSDDYKKLKQYAYQETLSQAVDATKV